MKLTPSQLLVLRNAQDGRVYCSERGSDLYSCYDRAQTAKYADKKVTATVERLSALGLLSIGMQVGMRRLWHVTAQGEQVLAQKEKTS